MEVAFPPPACKGPSSVLLGHSIYYNELPVLSGLQPFSEILYNHFL